MPKYMNSYSLFFSGLGYWDMIPLLIRMHYALYNDEWEFVIHHDRSDFSFYYGKALAVMNEMGIVRLVKVSEPAIMCKAMMWRMLPIWDSESEYVFCRDADSLLTSRQRYCVQEFIDSGNGLHGINDNTEHNIPLMGGMIGMKSSFFIQRTSFDSIQSMYRSANIDDKKWENRGADQDLLMNHVWPKMSDISMIHKMPLKEWNKEIGDVDRTLCSHIGACGIKKKMRDAIECYREFVPKNKISIIEDIEKITVGDILCDNFYNQ